MTEIKLNKRKKWLGTRNEKEMLCRLLDSNESEKNGHNSIVERRRGSGATERRSVSLRMLPDQYRSFLRAAQTGFSLLLRFNRRAATSFSDQKQCIGTRITLFKL